MGDMDHLIRVKVTGMFNIMSVVGYRDEEEFQFTGDGKPLFGANGEPVIKVVRVPVKESVAPGGHAYLDPAVTNIRALVRGGLVQIVAREPARPRKPAKGARS